MKRILATLSVLICLLTVACSQPAQQTPTSQAIPAIVTTAQPTATATNPPSITAQPSPTPTPEQLAEIAITATPLPDVTPCGVALPAVLPPETETAHDWQMPFLDETLIPEAAYPAIERFFTHPDDVSLVVYKVGYEGIGFYHNGDRPMPLASVSKLIQLVAYANQVDAGLLDPAQVVSESELEQFYLPRSDLSAHRRALAAHGDEPITVSNIVTMMMRYSSNSAADYLHNLLGQGVMEQTVIDLEMNRHSAPCSFIGRFLIMGDGSNTNSSAAIHQLASDSTHYGYEVAQRTERYLEDAQYRASAGNYWQQRRSPPISTQALFVSELETRGTAVDYARLMARIVQGEIGSPTTNAEIRAALEWPYEVFASNREQYQTIGYKNGTLPGALTSVYYAWPHDSDRPYVLALFYNNLPQDLYQEWRRDLPHDAFAHWLMSDPNALHIMHVWRDNAETP